MIKRVEEEKGKERGRRELGKGRKGERMPEELTMEREMGRKKVYKECDGKEGR